MATAFINATFPNLTDDGGACEWMAYLGRTAIPNRRLGRIVDFKDVAYDLVHAEIRLPDIAPAEFDGIDKLANAIDHADARRMRTMTDRVRWPQFGAAFIVALPPDDELTFDEAVELIERIVDRIIGRNKLAAVVAIHDPRLTIPGARNRHAHILVVLREVDRNGFGKKIRNLFARARRGPRAKHYLAEGLHWPGLSFEMQQSFFAELATDTVVDPPAPYSERRWSPNTLRNDPALVQTHRRIVQAQNIEMIEGPPGILVDRMLRGRGAMPVQELRHLLKRFVDSEANRQRHLERILADGEVVTLASGAGEHRPTRLTTRAVYDAMLRATAMVDRACALCDPAGGTVAERLAVVSQPNAEAVTRSLGTLARQNLQCSRQRPLLLGAKSDCEALAANLAEWRPIVGSISSLLKAPAANGLGSAKRAGIRRRGLVVVTHSETVDDQDLAAILATADAKQAAVVLGYDEGRRAGIAGPRLAAYAADVLAPPNEQIDTPGWIERHLRAGRVDRAIVAMHARGQIHFAAADDPRIDEAADFVVCDDPRRLGPMNDSLRAVREAQGTLEAGIAIGPQHLALQLCSGQWIAVTQTDYSTLPPTIRHGQLALIVDLFPDSQTIRVQLHDGAVQDIDLTLHPHVRPAFAVSIREARNAPRGSAIFIEATQPRYAWATLLLAATRDANARVRIDPAVARDVKTLIRAVRSSLPAALPSELSTRKDFEAEIAAVLKTSSMIDAPHTIASDAELLEQEWFELMPEPKPGDAEPPTTDSPRVAQPTPTFEPQEPEYLDAKFTIPPENAGHSELAHQTTSGELASPSEEDDFERIPMPQRAPPAEIPKHLHEDLRAILASGPDPRVALDLLQAAVGTGAPHRDLVGQDLLKLCASDSPTAALIHILMKPRPSERRQPDSMEEIDLPDELTARMPRAWTAWDLYMFRTDLRTMTCRSSVWNRAFNRPDSTYREHKDSGAAETSWASRFGPNI